MINRTNTGKMFNMNPGKITVIEYAWIKKSTSYVENGVYVSFLLPINIIYV